jgi:hypothetical protein
MERGKYFDFLADLFEGDILGQPLKGVEDQLFVGHQHGSGD